MGGEQGLAVLEHDAAPAWFGSPDSDEQAVLGGWLGDWPDGARTRSGGLSPRRSLGTDGRAARVEEHVFSRSEGRVVAHT